MAELMVHEGEDGDEDEGRRMWGTAFGGVSSAFEFDLQGGILDV
jgi:hypothetical protein